MNTDDEALTPRGGGSTPLPFAVENLSTGPAAHGYGNTGDGRDFAFQVRKTILRLEIYRTERKESVPSPHDVAALAELPVADVDLDDARSITALVRDAAAEARRNERSSDQPTTIRALLNKLGLVIDAI
ncbi:MAG: hypothetical protein L0H59_12030 [Tomitella sp.]|nr:hypothetical protein [Tomitella sp.]